MMLPQLIKINKKSKWRSGFLLFIISVAFLLPAAFAPPAPGERARPEKWALPINEKGLPNFHKVSRHLYRGAQPEKEGIPILKKMGIKTIVNLRNFHSDLDEIGDVTIGYERIPMNAWSLNEADVIAFLKIVTDKSKTPVFVHCLHGADRTGMMNAVYRMAVQGWSKEEALKEMVEGGYGYHEIWKNIPRFLDKLDIETIREKAGISKSAAAD
ncbi:MAG: dual specificity protein phosphatase family protein [Deltaproteobacteria bacterium]|nr:dual specificity protein phosphatase family protein [Deltaproteobacteria bacterium]